MISNLFYNFVKKIKEIIMNNIKKYIPLFFILLIIACNNQKETKRFSLKLELSNISKGRVYIEDINNEPYKIIDSSDINANGVCVFNTVLPKYGFYRVLLPKKEFVILLLDTTENVVIKADINKFSKTYMISGSKGSEEIYELNNYRKTIKSKVDSLAKIFNESEKLNNFEEIKRGLDSSYYLLRKDFRNYTIDFINKNISSLSSFWALSQELSGDLILNPNSKNDFKYYEKVDSVLLIDFPKLPQTKMLNEWMINKRKEFYEKDLIKRRLEIGAYSPEFILYNQFDEPLKLSSFRSKKLLLIFWASTSKFSRAENKILTKLYAKYKSKNIEFLSVSIDKNKMLWIDAIRLDNLQWSQCIGDLSIAKLYNIVSIPMIFLIDEQGKIVKKGIRGDEIELAIKEIVK